MLAGIDKSWDEVILEYRNTLKFGVYYSCTDSNKNSNVTVFQ